jgi:hypothetical protein
MLLIACSAHACSWSGPVSPIAENLRTSRLYALILVAAAGLCFFVARRTRRYWLPAGLALFLCLDWYAMGTAYGGDCGDTSLAVTRFGAVLGLVATWIFVCLQIGRYQSGNRT